LNLYGFMRNDGVNAVDPVGLEWWDPKDAEFLPSASIRIIGRGLHTGITAARVAGGIVPSVLSGDIFDESEIQTTFEPGQCEFLVTINGIANDEEAAVAMADLASETFRLPAARIVNNTHLPFAAGDILQILGHEIGLIDVTSRRTARQIKAAHDWGRLQNCNCITIVVVAHSQGTMVFRRSLPLLSADVKESIEYHGDGGETFIESGLGLRSVDNAWNRTDGKKSLFFGWDPVPLIGNYLNPLRLFAVPFYLQSGEVKKIVTVRDLNTDEPIAGNSHGWIPFYSWRYARE